MQGTARVPGSNLRLALAAAAACALGCGDTVGPGWSGEPWAVLRGRWISPPGAAPAPSLALAVRWLGSATAAPALRLATPAGRPLEFSAAVVAPPPEDAFRPHPTRAGVRWARGVLVAFSDGDGDGALGAEPDSVAGASALSRGLAAGGHLLALTDLGGTGAAPGLELLTPAGDAADAGALAVSLDPCPDPRWALDPAVGLDGVALVLPADAGCGGTP